MLHYDVRVRGNSAMLVVLQKLGAKEAQLIRYATSGDVTGDREEVVGYAGIILR